MSTRTLWTQSASSGRTCTSLPGFVLVFSTALLAAGHPAAAPDPGWHNLSSKRGEIPVPPGGSKQQTGAVVGDFDGDGVNDFILSFRQKPPALVWYHRHASG